ncbi:hypothetical protein CVT26_005059 [Gymnopilus dilepis]|uniref:Uncharacterized protein n=1 Tax=Gymnopilus dilepis TaxID=231916 RepID=A0A409W8B4_9AGAR|nr:hypothetical protein CVT26_005059 [Gymnopilus dilepis]
MGWYQRDQERKALQGKRSEAEREAKHSSCDDRFPETWP